MFDRRRVWPWLWGLKNAAVEFAPRWLGLSTYRIHWRSLAEDRKYSRRVG